MLAFIVINEFISEPFSEKLCFLIDCDCYRDSQLVSIERMRGFAAPHSGWRLGGHYRTQTLQDPETPDICGEMVFAGHDSAIAHMRSVAVAASCDLYKIKSATIAA